MQENYNLYLKTEDTLTFSSSSKDLFDL